MTANQINKEVEEQVEKVRQKLLAEQQILESLKLPEGTKTSICSHNCRQNEVIHVHWSVSLRKDNDFHLRDMIEIIELHRERMQLVPRYKQEGFFPSWGPETANHSFGYKSSTKVGDAVIELRQHGGTGFRSTTVSYWLEVPNVGWAEINIPVRHLPRDWDVIASYRRYSQETGEPSVYSIDPPRVGLPSSDLRTNMGSAGSWDHTAFWDHVDTFRADVLRAGIP